MSTDEIIEKLFAAGNWPAAAAGILTAAWIMFRGKNNHPEWAEKTDLVVLKEEVRDVDAKVDGLTAMVHDTRETLARIEGLLDGRKR